MSNRSRTTFNKRQKEQKRKEKQREKAERRSLRRSQSQAEAVSDEPSTVLVSDDRGEEPAIGIPPDDRAC